MQNRTRDGQLSIANRWALRMVVCRWVTGLRRGKSGRGFRGCYGQQDKSNLLFSHSNVYTVYAMGNFFVWSFECSGWEPVCRSQVSAQVKVVVGFGKRVDRKISLLRFLLICLWRLVFLWHARAYAQTINLMKKVGFIWKEDIFL